MIYINKNRPFYFASVISGLFAFVLIVPVVLVTLQNLSENIIFETSDIHFLVIEGSEIEVLQKVNNSIEEFDLNELVNLELTESESPKTLSVYFKLNSDSGEVIDQFIATLKSNNALVFKSENWKSHLADGYINNDWQLFSELVALLLFSIIYIKYFKPEPIGGMQRRLIINNFVKATIVTIGLVMLVQVNYSLFELLGVDFSQYEGITNESNSISWTVFASIVLLKPLLEEIVFRGLILRNFMLNNMANIGVWFTSLLFASLHQWQVWQLGLGVKISQFIIMLVVSTVFCWLYIKTGKLWVTIYSHTLYNGIHMWLIYYLS